MSGPMSSSRKRNLPPSGSEDDEYEVEEDGESASGRGGGPAPNEEEEDDGIEAPDFLEASNLREDEEEIDYYAKKLGIDPTIDEWDDYMIANGYSKILDGLTVGRLPKKEKVIEMVKAVRTPEEESARRDFTGLLNRIAPSNFASISAQIREAFAAHQQQVSVTQFTRCITQRLYSDANLPDMFLDVYSKALKEVPDAIQAVVDKLQESEKKDSHNVRYFLKALGEDMVSFYSTGSTSNKTVDEEVSKLANLARKLHMTTDVRRGVFYALMTGVDVVDAAAKIAKLQLSKTMKQDVPIVIMECCRNEAKYNPYYAAVTEFLATNDKHFVHSLVTALKNSIKLATSFEVTQLRNAAMFAAELVGKTIVDLSFLRGTKLSRLEGKQQMMIMIFFREFFQNTVTGVIDDELTKLANAPNFGNDVGKFLAIRAKPFIEKSKNYPADRKEIMKHAILELTKVQ